MPDDDDQLDGCELDFTDPEQVIEDHRIDAFVLFAGIDFTDDEAVQRRADEWREILRDV